jgi:hypothetical protein
VLCIASAAHMHSFSVLPQNLPIESDHGEHTCCRNAICLVTEHRPRARQRSVGIVGHKWSAHRATGSAQHLVVGLTSPPASHSPMCVRQFAACTAHLPNSARAGRPAEPLLGPFSRVLGISDVVPKGPRLLSAPDVNPKQRLSPVCPEARRPILSAASRKKVRSTVQVQDVPAEERIAVQIRAR